MTTLGWQIVRVVAILAILIWSLGPILIGVSTSLSTQREVNAVPTTWVPHHPSLQAYHDLLGGTSGHAGSTVTEAGTFSRSLSNSTILAAVSTVFILIFSTMAAYAVGRLRFRFGGAVLALLVGTMIVPIFVVVVSLFGVLANPPVGPSLIDTKGGLVLVFVATLTPLATWLLYTQVREMPPEPEEAALIDGCSRWKAFVRVVVPQMSSGIAAVAAITMLSVWGEFLIPLLLTQTQNAKPVTVLITEYVGKYTTNYPILAAAGVLALMPPALLALALNKRITGMLAGSS
jgi:multiple sugar transport system permease protein